MANWGDRTHTDGSGAAEHTHGSGATEQALAVDAIEKRTARDGHDYSYQEFEDFYGERLALTKWLEAPPATGTIGLRLPLFGTIAPEAAPATTAHVAAPAVQSSAAEHASSTDQPDEQAVSPIVLLQPENALQLRAASRHLGGLTRQEIARSALESAVRNGCASPIPLDELFHGMSWEEYIVWHKEATKIIGRGVVEARAEAIKGVRDPNRHGQLRIDFVIYRADGSYCRLHPGSKLATDAEVQYFDAVRTASGAAEHALDGSARNRWVSIPAVPFDMDAVATIPQSDRLGKAAAFASLSQLSVGELPTSSDATFQWWLFLANLGDKTQKVIGEGIVAAELSSIEPDAVLLKFTRLDQSEIQICISRDRYGAAQTRILT